MRLDVAEASVEILDEVASDGPHPVRLAFHLGPTVEATCVGARAELRWTGAGRRTCHGVIELPSALSWRAARGLTDPPLGWYSPAFGQKVPATVLVGSGTSAAGPFRTLLRLGTDRAGDDQAEGSSPTAAVAGTARTAMATARSSR